MPVLRNHGLGVSGDNKSRPMINKPPPFKGLDIRIPTILPIAGRGFMNQGSGKSFHGHLAEQLLMWLIPGPV